MVLRWYVLTAECYARWDNLKGMDHTLASLFEATDRALSVVTVKEDRDSGPLRV